MWSKTFGTVLLVAALAGGCKKKETEDLSAAPPPPPVREEPRPVADVIRTPVAVGTFAEVFFAVDSAELADDQMTALHRNYEALAATDVNVRIEGHADERGTEPENVELGAQRANAVRDWLVAKGIDATRIRTVSFGEARPEVAAETESAYARNRRVELVGLPRDDS